MHQRTETHVEEPPPDLFPQELSQRKHARSLSAQAQQANEHDEKQDNIGNEGTDGAKFDNLGVAWQAGTWCRVHRPELEIDAIDLDGQSHMNLSFTRHMANTEPCLLGFLVRG
jgi:hypothetical protein